MDITLVLSRVAAITIELVVADTRPEAADTIEPMAAIASIIAEGTAGTVAELGIAAITAGTGATIVSTEAVIVGIGAATVGTVAAGIEVAINIEAVFDLATADIAVDQVVAAIAVLAITTNLVTAIALPPSVQVSRQSHYRLGRPSLRQLQQLTSLLMGNLVLQAYRLQSMHPSLSQRSCQGKFLLLSGKAHHTVSFLWGTFPSKQGRLLFNLVHTLDSRTDQTTLDQ